MSLRAFAIGALGVACLGIGFVAGQWAERSARRPAELPTRVASAGVDAGASRSTSAGTPASEASEDGRKPSPVGGAGTRFRWAPKPKTEKGAEPSSLQQQIEALEALGYAAGSQPPAHAGGVARSQRASRSDSPRYLVNDGHAPSAWLMDERGKVLHRWHKAFDDAFPGNSVPDGRQGLGYFRRVHLLSGGALLAIYEGYGLIALDAASNLLWAYAEPVHHDLSVLADGTIYTLTRHAHADPELTRAGPVLEDFVVKLDRDGRELRRFSVFDAVRESPYRALFQNTRRTGDIFHTNTIAVLDGRQQRIHPAFKRGHLLLSLLGADAVVVVDPASERVVWALAGVFNNQHEPSLTEAGHLLVLDNQGDLGKSQILEFDLHTHQIVWRYSGRAHGFYTATCGTAQRLPSGFTLITESDPGRAFIVTPAGETVWEYFTPNRAGDRNQFVATLFEVQQLPSNSDLRWLQP